MYDDINDCIKSNVIVFCGTVSSAVADRERRVVGFHCFVHSLSFVLINNDK